MASPVHLSHGSQSTIDMCGQTGVSVRIVFDAELTADGLVAPA